jgi:hypothetical protein
VAVAVVLAVLTVGLGFALKALAALFRRDWERGSLTMRGEPVTAEVVIVIPAHGYGPGIAGSVASAARLVPLGDIVVVADQGTLQHVNGVNTLATDAGPGEAVQAALAEFTLAERYAHVLVLDPDHRPHPRYLDRTLPLFGDPEVAGVAGYARTEWATARPSPLTAYRERALALQQWVLTFARTRPGTEMTRALPSPARLYRASALDGLAPEASDLHTSARLLELGRGRVIVVRGALVDTRDPDRLGVYFRQLRQWSCGLWQAAAPPMTAYRAEQAVTALAMLAAPVLAATGVLGWQAVVAGVVVPDYLLTLLVALLRRDHRFLLPGLVFPLIRLVDAAAFLLPARRRWLLPVRPAREPAEVRPRRAARPLAALGWAAAVAAGAALVARVAAATFTLPASPAEPLLVDAAFGRVAGLAAGTTPGGLAPLNLQLITHSGLTGALRRHDDLLTGVRELSVAACAVTLVGLLLTALALRLRPWAVAIALGAAALAVPVVTALAPLGPGTVAAAWLAAAGFAGAFLTRSRKPLAVVLLGIAGAVGTAPALVLPVAVGAAAWAIGARAALPGLRWPLAVATPLLVGGGAYAALAASGLLGVPAAAASGPLLEVCAAACAVGLLLRRARPVAAGALTAALADGDVLLPAVLAGTALVVALLLDEATRAIPAGAAFLAQRAAVATAAAGVVVAAVASAGVLAPTAPRVDHKAVAAWFAAAAPEDAELSAPGMLWSDLRRDLDDDRVRLGGRLPLSVSTEDELGLARGPGQVVAEFDGATVRLNGIAGGYAADGSRAAAGTQLAANSRLSAPGPVLAALRSGGVDLRPMAVIAQLTGAAPVSIAETSNPPAETGSPLPHRTVVVSEVDGVSATERNVETTLRDWLGRQRAPYAPDEVRSTPAGLALSWRLPALDPDP